VQENTNQAIMKCVKLLSSACSQLLTFNRSQGVLQTDGGAQNATNFEDDFGKYASPYLISHLTSTAL
jgi:hypothetical protein